MYDELYGYLKTFMTQNYWESENIGEWARSIFTTICLYCNIDADTERCNWMLRELYNTADMESVGVQYEEFENFMLEHIV